jgi:hypothetical protein
MSDNMNDASEWTYSTYCFGFTDNEGKSAEMIVGGPEYARWEQIMASFIDFLEVSGYRGVKERVAIPKLFASREWSGPVFNPEESL